MKKLIAISVVFALVAGAVFAVDVTGTVIGTVDVIKSTTADGDKVKAGGGMDRIRLDGAGETENGDFGGYIRAQGNDFTIDAAYAWWKPIDQFKLIIGTQSDGFWGKEGVTGWSFNQIPFDTGIATNYGIWYGGSAIEGWGWGSSIYAGGPYMHNRYTFFEGWLSWGAGVEITPADVASINIAIPYIDKKDYKYPGNDESYDIGGQAKDVYKAAIAQLDLHFDFGNIAITYDGGGRAVDAVGAGGAIYGYVGLNVIENLGIDVGFSYHLTDKEIADYKHPIGVGVGVKYATDSFGVKFRTTVALAGDDEYTYINSSVLPFFNISDNLSAFVNAGVGVILPDEGDSVFGWYFNPYLRVGAEWGPSFYAGIKVETNGVKNEDDKSIINWSVPVALVVSF